VRDPAKGEPLEIDELVAAGAGAQGGTPWSEFSLGIAE